MIYRDPDETERLLLELKARQRGMTLNEYFKHIGTPEMPGSVPFIMLACFVAPFWRDCGELLFKPRRAIGTGLCSDFASGKNLDLQLWVVSS